MKVKETITEFDEYNFIPDDSVNRPAVESITQVFKIELETEDYDFLKAGGQKMTMTNVSNYIRGSTLVPVAFFNEKGVLEMPKDEVFGWKLKSAKLKATKKENTFSFYYICVYSVG